jgi:hypothetical protein
MQDHSLLKAGDDFSGWSNVHQHGFCGIDPLPCLRVRDFNLLFDVFPGHGSYPPIITGFSGDQNPKIKAQNDNAKFDDVVKSRRSGKNRSPENL